MTTPAGLRRPPGRYDEPRRLPRPVLLGGAVILLSALVGLSFLAYRHYSSTRAPFTNIDYDVESEHAVVIRFQVVLDPGDTARCVLQARDRDNIEVGSHVLTVGPADQRVVPVSYRLSTQRRAVAGVVLSCVRES